MTTAESTLAGRKGAREVTFEERTENDADDGGVLARARAGDRRAFSVLVRRHQDGVFRFLLRLVGNRDEALELTQDTFVKVFQSLPSWQPEAPFRAWLFRIARNAALDLLRRRQALGFVAFDELAPADGEAAWPDPAPRPEEQLDDRRRIALLDRVLRELPAEQREVLLLRELEDMSYAEIAAALDVNEGTVKSRLARARAAALDRFRHHAGEKHNG